MRLRSTFEGALSGLVAGKLAPTGVRLKIG
jgi:hypothetical protein